MFKKIYLETVNDGKLPEETQGGSAKPGQAPSPELYAPSKIDVILQYFHHHLSRLLSPGYGNRAF